MLRDIVESLFIALLIALPIKFFIASPFIVRQTSMFPTFKDGDYLVVDKLSYRWSIPKRGDVVVFTPPQDTNIYYIKRIIGLPGETVEVSDNKVTIFNKENPDGFDLEEPYVSSLRNQKTKTTLDSNSFFVMGDNRAVSSDSRNWGALDRSLISGKVFARLFPFSSISYKPGSIIN